MVTTSNSREQLRARGPLFRQLDAPSWRVDDALMHLREWGTAIIHPLPSGGRAAAIIGTARNSWLRIKSAPGAADARLVRTADGWTVRDLGGPAGSGVRVDGIVHSVASLSPGAEIEISGTTLIAESARLVAVRELLARLIGWSPARAADVDLALRAVRLSALRRGPLLLTGDKVNALTAARLLHHHTIGPERPFVLCAPRQALRRHPQEQRIDHPITAVKAAASGTLCIWYGRHVTKLIRSLPQRPTWPVQIIVVCTHPALANAIGMPPIVLPALQRRTGELNRIIDEYLADASTALNCTILPADHAWIRRHDADTHASIENAARRAAVLRSNEGGITQSARDLGLAHSALSEWVARRKIPNLSSGD